MLRTVTPPLVALLLLLALGFGPGARADEAPEASEAKTLSIGDKAPDIDITHWIKGVEMDRRGAFTPVTSFGDGRVYVLEFWATWCGPCVGGMPHLSELQEKYADKGVTIIGVSDESLPKVTGFLFQTYKRDGKLQNDRTRYTLTTDPDQSVKKDYFLAAGQTGIPCAFVIGKDGFVEWIGHPSRMDDALSAVVAGTWDRSAFKATFEKQQAEKKAMQEANLRMRAALKAGDYDTCLTVIDELLAAQPDNLALLNRKFMMLVGPAGRPDEAYAMGEALLKSAWESAPMLNQIAWSVVDDKAIQKRDLDFALKAAERANELKESKDAAVLDTLARVHFDKGNLSEALRLQRLAAEQAGDTDMGAGIREILKTYEKAAAEATESGK
jgi:thiol-disulfide isomerase/thioredoxin